MSKLNSIADLQEILDARTIAEYLNIGYVKALHLIRYGGLPYMKLGNTYRVYKSAFVKWLESEENRILKVE